MRLLRPYIPISIRKKVIVRQAKAVGAIVNEKWSLKDLLHAAHLDGAHLDHDPALCNRQFNERTGKYTPDANDPRYLVYRTKEEHDIKTRVRGDGAQLSDLAMLRKNKRIANKDRQIRKIPSRPFRRA